MRNHHTSVMGRRRLARALGMCLAGLACAAVFGSQALLLVPGASRIMMYRGMRKVIVVDPTVADIVVASRAELILFGKATGQTKLYVWDAAGRHEYAVVVKGKPSVDALVSRLRDFLPAYATARVLDEKSILLEGVAPSGRDHTEVVETAQKIAGDIKVVDLMQTEGEEISPAERTAAQLRRLLGVGYEYVVWGDTTVLVKGPMDDETMAQVQKLGEALGGGIKIVALKSAGGAGAAPTEEIAQALGRSSESGRWAAIRSSSKVRRSTRRRWRVLRPCSRCSRSGRRS